MRAATLNVASMTGKGRELIDVMERRKVGILCVQETKWKASKARSIGGGFKLLYHGVDGRRNGVSIILKEDYAKSVVEVKRKSGRILLHRTAKSTQAWCENCHVHVLDWPANSPHFNPIENLWGIVKKKLHKHQPNTCEQLKDAIKTCWNEVTPHECQQLIHSMPRRIEAVIKARGDATKY